MKSKVLLYSLIVFTMAYSCNHPALKNPENWNEKEITRWFQSGNWKSGWEVIPDESINRKELAVQYYKNNGRWEKAFHFLESTNLEEISTGRYELEGEQLFVNVDDYTTRNEEDSRFEAHRRYADIQYVVHGEEKIGILPLERTKEMIPYDSIKDIIFLSTGENNYRIASPERFFVFFPGDAHRPGVKTGDNRQVRKVVVKVRIDD